MLKDRMSTDDEVYFRAHYSASSIVRRCGLLKCESHKSRTIKQAAIRDDAGKVWTLPRPARHHNIVKLIYDSGSVKSSYLDGQGFILDNNVFVSRIEAAKIALSNGQCIKLIAPPNLYSEDVW